MTGRTNEILATKPTGTCSPKKTRRKEVEIDGI